MRCTVKIGYMQTEKEKKWKINWLATATTTTQIKERKKCDLKKYKREREKKTTHSRKNIYKKKQSNINKCVCGNKRAIFSEERVHILQKRNPNIGISIAHEHFLLPGRQRISLTFSQPIRRHISLCCASLRRAEWSEKVERGTERERKRRRKCDHSTEYNWGAVLIVQSIQFRCFELRFHCCYSLTK